MRIEFSAKKVDNIDSGDNIANGDYIDKTDKSVSATISIKENCQIAINRSKVQFCILCDGSIGNHQHII
jgi:hypothetical protein